MQIIDESLKYRRKHALLHSESKHATAFWRRCQKALNMPLPNHYVDTSPILIFPKMDEIRKGRKLSYMSDDEFDEDKLVDDCYKIPDLLDSGEVVLV